MAEQHTYNYSLEDIQRYLSGGMNAKEMHEVERAALQDPFLADAIDGYAAADLKIAHDDLNSIHAALQKNTEETKVVAMPFKRFGWMKVAAVVLFVVGAGAVSFLLLNKTNNEKPLAKNEVVVAPLKDSVKGDIAESKPAEDANSLGLKEQKAAAPVSKSNIEKSKSIVKDEELNDKRIMDEAVEPAAANRSMMMKQAPAIISSRNDSTLAYMQGLSIADSTLENEEASAIAKNYSLNKRYIDIKIRGYSAVRDSTKNAGYMKMSELVVTKLQSKKAAKNVVAKDSSSTPVGGWQSFQEYVYKKLNKPYDSTATGTSTKEMSLEFSINEEGLPYNFFVLQSPDDARAKEAIEIIKHGPRWISADKKKKVNITLTY